MQNEISLKELIRTVSDELMASRAERLAANRPAIFEVDGLTIEVSFIITESDAAGGGFDLKILKANAKSDYRQESIHKITLTLSAIKDDAGRVLLRELGDEVPLRPRQDG